MNACRQDDAGEREQLQDLLTQRDQQLAALHASSSWRLTAPLRWARRLREGLLKKLGTELVTQAPVRKDYAEWIRRFESFNSEVSANLSGQIDGFAHVPLFSVLLPVDNPNADELRTTLDSVLRQIYPYWELCIAVGSGASAEIHDLLMCYSQAQQRIKVATCTAPDLVQLSNQALAMVSDKSTWVLRLDATYTIAPQAMFLSARVVNECKDCQIIYADEDMLDAVGQRCAPVFKPDWSLDLHLAHDLIGHIGLYRTALVLQVGGYQTGMAETMDFDLSLRCAAQVTPTQIVHQPYVLFHREAADFTETNATRPAGMAQRWDEALCREPTYSPNLTLEAQDFGLAWPPRVPPLIRDVVRQPSQAPLHQRLAQLAKDTKRIAYFAENVHSSTFRYRAANMAEVLNDVVVVGDVQFSAACFFSSDLQHAAHIVQSADILVISRARYDPDLATLVQQFQVQGKRVWFDIDDLVFDTQKIDLIISTAGQRATDEVLNYWYGVVGRMAQALRLCDGVITTQAYLANKIKLFSNLPVKIIPNFANAAQLAVSAPLYQEKYQGKDQRQFAAGSTRRERIKLGYFSGSSSHNGDLSLISHALERVMAADARVDLVLVGHVDVEQAFGARFGGYLKGHLADRVTLHPFVDYVALQALIADVDFNLVPLQVNEFTHCKSELKFVDAAIVGTLTIASPTFAYAETIRHGENGYLAEDDQWEAVLLQAIAVRDADVAKHRRMTAAAYQDVQQCFTWQTQRSAIVQALEVG